MAGIHKDTLHSKPYSVSDDDWDKIFKRNKQNSEKNRHKRSKKEKK